MSTHATAVSGSPIYTGPRPTNPRPTGPRLSDEQLSLLKTQLVGLRRLSEATGFSTNKLVVDMMSRLSDADLILLGVMFAHTDGGNR